ncbi:semaphorin-4D-like [Polypterus senegalus]|uniref:semaphorin-4D-like n=1 Tax=Polypterus senegalus TaxID=55291 RepID=UPI0019662BEB|nr:semaphorin-4D-like [Polypterus senegalus]
MEGHSSSKLHLGWYVSSHRVRPWVGYGGWKDRTVGDCLLWQRVSPYTEQQASLLANPKLNLLVFKEPDILNYSTFLLDEDKKTIYVGAREAILELDIENITLKKKQVLWNVPESVHSDCVRKDKSSETDCRNYVRVLQMMNASHLYVCGTYAYRPSCDYLSVNDFKLKNNIEDGKGKCPYNPYSSFASVMVDGELYSGTEFNFLGDHYVIYRSNSTNKITTHYAPAWLKEPRFVHADVIRESVNSENGDDDKIYFFFTEVSVELNEDLASFLIPRIARVCKPFITWLLPIAQTFFPSIPLPGRSDLLLVALRSGPVWSDD